MKNNRLKFWNRVKYQIFILFVLTNGLVGCNKNFIKFPITLFPRNKSIPSIIKLPPVHLLKDSIINIKSISTLDRRFNQRKGLHKIQFMKVDTKDRDSTYNRTLRNLLKLQTEFKIEIAATKNDSLFKI